MKNFTKFAAVAFVAFFAASVSAATLADFGTTTIKVGSKGPAVMAVQSALNVCQNSTLAVDGMFGPKTAEIFKAFQMSKGLTVDGLIGANTKAALLACSTAGNPAPAGNPGSDSATLKGGAGDLTIDLTTTGVQSSVKENSSEKVLGAKLEADGSDISVTSVKVVFENTSGNGSKTLSKYVDEVSVMLGTKEVGSMSADDFSKNGSEYSKSIALTGAVVKEDAKANLYVVVKTVATVDEITADFDITVDQVRYEDATGAIFSTDTSGDLTETFGFDDAAADDDLSIKSSTADPDATNLVVDDNSTSDEYLVGAFKFDVADDSSDITLNELNFTVNFMNLDVNNSGTVDSSDDSTSDSAAENVVDSMAIKIAGEDYTAELNSGSVSIVNGTGTAIYNVDLGGDVTISAGDVEEVKVYATFAEQDGNYNSGAKFSVDLSADVISSPANTDSGIDAEGEDELDNTNINGSNFNGEDHTLITTGAAVTYVSSAYTPVVPPSYSGGASVDGVVGITFKVEAVGDDVVLAADGTDINVGITQLNLITGTATETGKTLSCSGVTLSGGDYTISEGDTKTCTYSVSFSAKSGFIKLEMTNVAGTAVSNIISSSY